MTTAARLASLVFVLAMPVADARTAAAEAPRDADFGVVAQGAIGLERRVEMYQWQPAGDGYRLGWSEGVVDSSGFRAGHENPAEAPLRSQRWAPRRVTLDGSPVAPEAIEALGRWEVLRPDFSALPGNLSATFQPEGDGLGSAANPVHPEVGDLKITWRELRMPPDYAGLVLEDGRWVPDPKAVAARRASGPRNAAPDRAAGAGFGWILLGAAAAGLAAAVFMLRRRRRG